ncbi:type II secretion system F family protein [Demequina sp. NBRC 110057]|uniref:type II secretion system F family protein n=1 Tax=Demequina sp. NBRC 110057 TaxID=1570346 RepID=UPI0009FE68D0|nr:type II secretion system F family protein [Demequina sp. NBRC 110057]
MRRRRSRGGQAPPDPARALADAVALLESGLPPARAWGLAGLEVGQDGLPAPEAWGGDDGLRDAVGAAGRLAGEGGMPLAGVLRRVLVVVHARREAADACEAALAGPRMSARVLAWLPLAGLGLAALLDPGAITLVATTPLGWVLLAAGALLTWLGRRWTRALLARADPPRSDIPVGVGLALVDAVLAAGVDVAGALTRVGSVVGGAEGEALREAGARLAAGAAWDDAWGGEVVGSAKRERHDGLAGAVRGALRAAHLAGASAAPALAAAVDAELRDERRVAQKAAAELSVTLSLPLTLCLLPAFILVGVVPLIASVIASADLGALT